MTGTTEPPNWDVSRSLALSDFHLTFCGAQIKMEESEDGSECDVTALGTKEELERFCETMQFNVLSLFNASPCFFRRHFLITNTRLKSIHHD